MKNEIRARIRCVLLTPALVLATTAATAHPPPIGDPSHFAGVGVAGELGYGADNVAGVSITAHRGFFYWLSGLVNADVGYRFDSGGMQIRLGAEVMYLVGGLHVGLLQTIDSHPSTGISVGGVVYLRAVLSDSPFTLGLFLGGQMYLNRVDRHPHELLVSLRILWDFWRS